MIHTYKLCEDELEINRDLKNCLPVELHQGNMPAIFVTDYSYTARKRRENKYCMDQLI